MMDSTKISPMGEESVRHFPQHPKIMFSIKTVECLKTKLFYHVNSNVISPNI